MTVTSARTEIEIIRLDEPLIESAAALHSSSFEQLRSLLPFLPADTVDVTRTAEHLRRIPAGSGVAAVQAGRLLGYLTALRVEGARGPGNAAYTPEWAWAVDPTAPDELLTALYAAASPRWAAAGWTRHLISALALGAPINRELAWLGFGLCVVDAVRPIPDLIETRAPGGVSIGIAAQSDVEELTGLHDLLDAHLSAPPTFLYRDTEEDPRARMARWVADSCRRLWVARAGGQVVSFICLSAEGGDVAAIVRHPAIVHVVAAFTRPEWRSKGVGEALLAEALGGAGSDGFAIAAVDFEPANPLARRFWSRFFTPVCLSYERTLDPRVAVSDAVR